MNDIQTKENIYSSSCAAVEKQQYDLTVAQNNAVQMQNMYREAVVHVAIESEKLRRKKDSLVMLVTLGIVAVVGLILLLINSGVGAFFIIGVGVAVFLIKNNNQEKDAANYQSRKNFFMKYFRNVPAAGEIKWKK